MDGAIYRSAGEGLFAESAAIGGCATGDTVITGGHNLPCKYVIHTVGPVWHGGFYGERQLLYSCYRRSLEVASQNGCKTLAFPLISSGAYGFSNEKPPLRIKNKDFESEKCRFQSLFYHCIYNSTKWAKNQDLFFFTLRIKINLAAKKRQRKR